MTSGSKAQDGGEIHLFYGDIHVAPLEYKGRIELVSARRLANKLSEFVFRLLNGRAR